MISESKIRSPIVTVVGHVDHGKTSILDYFRQTNVQGGESGGITQKISYTKFPLLQLKNMCPLLDEKGLKLDLPGFLFIDTPGHAAFTNLRKRGGSLADLAILVVNIKEGIKPQTAEVLQILRNFKTPFLIALNKIDNISGWKRHPGELKNSIESQAINVSQEFQEALLTFQGSLSSHGFESDLFYEIKDFTKRIAIVPCSARTGEGMPELLFVLCGLCQNFLKEKLKISDNARGVVLEIKKEKGMNRIESILYDGVLSVGDEIIVGSFDEPILTKVRAIEEVESLSFKYKNVKEISAACGMRLYLTNKENILPGMPFEVVKGDIEKLKKEFKKEISGAVEVDKEGIIVKADSLGSLDALLNLLKDANIKVVKAGIGNITKGDVISAEANLEINPLNAVVAGFNVELDEGVEVKPSVEIFTEEVVYKLIDDLNKWREIKSSEIERERLMELSSICKLEVLKQHVFRNSNPAVFGVKVLGGKLKVGNNLIDQTGESVARVKSLQKDRGSVYEASEGEELAVSLPGVNFERRMKEVTYLYSDMGLKMFKKFKENKDLLSGSELKILDEIARVKGF